MSRLAIIPARGGSKRIPLKNIKLFLGKPIISYSIEAAKNSNLFDEIMVSTDSLEIKRISESLGASVPFLRSQRNSDDHATTADVIIEVLEEYKKVGKEFDEVCCIYATAPFVTPRKLQEAFKLLAERKANSVYPVVPFSYPILRSLIIEENGYIQMKWPKYLNARSQDIPTFYHDVGQFYCAKSEAVLEFKTFTCPKAYPLIYNELEVQDIDNLIDWEVAELKYNLLKSQNE